MLFAFVVLFVIGYALAASRAARRGNRPLAAVVGVALLVFVGLVILVGVMFQVPAMGRLLLYALVFVGPGLLVPAALLWRRAGSMPYAAGTSRATALTGAVVGLVVGWVVVIFGLRVW